MTTDDSSITISLGNDLRTLFPGYYLPSGNQRAEAYRQGLVSLDANAILDLYRFTPRAREEFFQILEKFRSRLFVPHQVALEFQRNRMRVAYERLAKAGSEEKDQINKHLTAAWDRLREFANRYQIGDIERDRLCGLIDNARTELGHSIANAVAYDLDWHDIRKGTDSVLRRIDQLFHGRIGSPFESDELREVLKEAEKRLKDKVPPGYKDVNKGDQSEASGDYVLWSQLLREVARHHRPVLLVSNEQKEDWVLRGPSGEILGPRPELVLEMRSEAGCDLHTVTVAGLLKEAPGFLGSSVSDSTIREAEALPHGRYINLAVTFSQKALEVHNALSGNEAALLEEAFAELAPQIVAEETWWPSPKVKRVGEDFYSLRWTPYCRAVFAFSVEGALGTTYVNFFVHRITRKDSIEPI